MSETTLHERELHACLRWHYRNIGHAPTVGEVRAWRARAGLTDPQVEALAREEADVKRMRDEMDDEEEYAP